MAFTNTNLVLLAHGNDYKRWAYVTTADTAAQVRAVGFFNNTDDDVRMSVGDTIIVFASDQTVRLKVASISSGAVTTRADTGVAIFAHGLTTSVAVPGAGVVTFNPTSDAMGTFPIEDLEPGALLELINISTTTSATALFGGVTTSLGFGILGENTLELIVGGSVQLRALTTTTTAIVGGVGGSTTSLAGRMTLTN